MSLRVRLSLILGSAFVIIWVLAAAWMLRDLRQQMMFSLDQRLVASARMVAGLIDKDEQPEEVAHREAEEEAGLTFSALWPMTRYFPSPGGSDEYVHLFLGRCSSEGAGGLHGLEEEGEDIRVRVWAFEDALQAVRDGRICNAATIIGLQWLALNRDEVRGMWK